MIDYTPTVKYKPKRMLLGDDSLVRCISSKYNHHDMKMELTLPDSSVIQLSDENRWHLRDLDCTVDECDVEAYGLLQEIQKLNLPEGFRLLDIGTGRGMIVEGLIKNGIDAYGIDIDEAGLPGNTDHYICGDLTSIPFYNNFFDIISEQMVFCQMSDIDKRTEEYEHQAMLEVARVLKPDGYFITTGQGSENGAYYANSVRLVRITPYPDYITEREHPMRNIVFQKR